MFLTVSIVKVMTAPPEVSELLRKAVPFWRAVRDTDCIAGVEEWERALDELLDRMLSERPELRCRS